MRHYTLVPAWGVLVYRVNGGNPDPILHAWFQLHYAQPHNNHTMVFMGVCAGVSGFVIGKLSTIQMDALVKFEVQSVAVLGGLAQTG
jgi:hypothetical protein